MAYASWHTTVTDLQGNVIPNASIYVVNETTGVAPQLYADRQGLVPMGNPFTAEADGTVNLYVAGGAYRIRASFGAWERTWRYVGIGTAQEYDVEDIVGRSVSYDPQTPTSAEQAQARANIGIGEALGNTVQVVPQSFTPEQQEQARANIGRDNYITPQDFGAIGDGVADDTAALNAAIAAGKALYWGGAENVYRITDTLTLNASSHLSWLSNGAKIVVDTANSIQRAVYIELWGHGMDTFGPLFLDCQDNSFTGFDIRNSSVSKVDVSLFGFRVKNCYRTSTSMSTGDGIYVRGNFNKVHISDAAVENIHMAEGAGDPFNQGVTGIAVIRDNTWGDANLIIIDDFSISGVYSEDPAYKPDQDGIRAFTAYNSGGAIPSEGVVFISNGLIKNCHGRAVKSQSEHTSVSDLMIVRNSSIYGGGYMGNFEIDLQVAGGMIRNINCQYNSNFPTRVIQATLRSTEARLNATVVTVDNIIINQFGSGTGIERIVSSTSNYQTNASITMSGISLLGAKSPQYSLYLSAPDVRTSYLVNINGLLTRASVCHVYRAGSVQAPCFITGTAIRTIGASAPFTQSEVPGSMNTSLLGANSGVS